MSIKVKDLEKKVGQLLVVGVPETALTQKHREILSRIGVGGVILFKHNYANIDQLVELTNTIQKCLTEGEDSYLNLPGWIAVDQEGGRVQRFGNPFTHFPPQEVWGKLNSPKTCFEAGYVLAKELRACGINVNFSPVIDVRAENTSNAIGDRAFSSDPEVVAALGSATIRGLQRGGVLGVAKHFPGHGAVAVDSHVDLPVCDRSQEELELKDWIPFRRVIRSKAEAVMTAHIVYSKIDPDRPATFSRKILQDILRKEMRHSKIIFSDDLEMGAIQNKYSLEEAAFLAISAGCDQVLLCHDFDAAENVWRHLISAFESGAIPLSKLDESLARIAEAKTRYLRPFSFANVEFAQATVGAPKFKEVAESIRRGVSVENGPSVQE